MNSVHWTLYFLFHSRSLSLRKFNSVQYQKLILSSAQFFLIVKKIIHWFLTTNVLEWNHYHKELNLCKLNKLNFIIRPLNVFIQQRLIVLFTALFQIFTYNFPATETTDLMPYFTLPSIRNFSSQAAALKTTICY